MTAFPQKSEFDKVVIALVWTVVINIAVGLLRSFLTFIGRYWSFGEWSIQSDMVCSMVFAVVISITWAGLYNHNTIHSFLSHKHKFLPKITNRTSYPSEWFGTFSETEAYVILHFRDGKRLMGWPREWPNDAKNGHFVLEDASWLAVDENGQQTETRLLNVKKIMVDTTEINMVEFLGVLGEK
jgi:hypothetical protein